MSLTEYSLNSLKMNKKRNVHVLILINTCRCAQGHQWQFQLFQKQLLMSDFSLHDMVSLSVSFNWESRVSLCCFGQLKPTKNVQLTSAYVPPMFRERSQKVNVRELNKSVLWMFSEGSHITNIKRIFQHMQSKLMIHLHKNMANHPGTL